MAGIMYVPNLDLCMVTVKDSGEVLPLIQCPAYWNLVRDHAAITQYIKDDVLPTPGYGKFDCATYIDPSDLGYPESVTMEMPFAEINGKDPLFKQHCREGKVVVNDRQIGVVRCVATGGYVLGRRGIGTRSRGWFLASDIGFSAAITDRRNPAEALLIYYDRVVLPSKTPPPDLWDRVFGRAVNGVLPTDLVDPEPDTATVTSALAAANSGAYDMLTEVAELPETLKFLKQAIASALVLGDETGAWSPKGAIRHSAAHLAQVWLAYRYAVMPLIYSIQDIKKMLSNCKRRYAEFKQSDTFSIDAPSIDGFRGTSSVTIKGRAFIKRRFDPMSYVNALLNALQINPFVTGFELMRFSFILDWFLNITNTILAFTGNSECSEQASTWSNRTFGAFDYMEEGGTRRALFVVDFYHRVKLNPLAHSGLTVDVAMNWKRSLDSASLGILRLESEILKRKYYK